MPKPLSSSKNSTPTRLSAQLKRGIIHIDLAATDLNPADFFDFAERNNPKRAFLFVSKVLGRHIPVKPALMEHSYQALAAKIPTNLPGPVLMIGMAETAVGLGAGVHRAYSQQRNGDAASSDVVYLVSTRHPVGDGSENTQLFARFEEEHSHASSHLIHLPRQPEIRELMLNARSLVLVDDEASTGNTFINLFRALTQAGLNQLEQLVTCTLTDWSAGAVSRTITQLPVQEVSLLQGSYSFEEDLQAPLPEMPDVATTAAGAWPINPAQDWGRLGVTHVADDLGTDITVEAGERILVIGTGEFVWRPFLLAERLEKAGAKVHFSSTSRSPIALGHAIKSAFYFTDNYGLGIPNYLYNVDPSQYDRIFLCAETPAAALPATLVQQLGAKCLGNLGSGSYAAKDVCFLLQEVTLATTDVAEKEYLIQTQKKHYSEMISLEKAPSAAHLTLYQQALAQHGLRMATEVQRLALGLQQQFQQAGNTGPLVLLSLVRAGLPLGVLLRRALIGLGCDAVHYGISIIRDRGLDKQALNAVIAAHGAKNLIFVDGWTGKGAIATELSHCLAQDPRFTGAPKLVVLADPCGQAWMAASAEDWLIPSGILGATVSGLVSRSIWPAEGGLHGCIYYTDLAAADVSREFVEAIDQQRLRLGCLEACQPWTVAEKISLQQGAHSVISQLAEQFLVTNLNRLKPGIAEATRAVLRRMPEQVLVRDKQDSDVQLLLHLALSHGVLVQELGASLGAYRAVTLIRGVD